MSDSDLEAEIARVRTRLTLPNGQLLTKAFNRHLHLLEKVRADRVTPE